MGAISEREERRRNGVVAALIGQQEHTTTYQATAEGRAPKGKTRTRTGEVHIQKKVFLTEDLDAALRQRVYRDKTLDISGHVRAALRIYLAEELANPDI